MANLNPTTYSEAKVSQNEMVEEGNAAHQRFVSAVAALTAAKQALQTIDSRWATARAFIASEAASNPGHAGYQALLEEDSLLHADYLDAKSRAEKTETDLGASLAAPLS